MGHVRRRGLLGRVVDGLGKPLDGGLAPPAYDRCVVRVEAGATLNPLERPVIATPFATGVRAIDGLLTCGVGQRTASSRRRAAARARSWA